MIHTLNDKKLFNYLVCAVLAHSHWLCPKEVIVDPLSNYTVMFSCKIMKKSSKEAVADWV